jgi:hypothetical protein
VKNLSPLAYAELRWEKASIEPTALSWAAAGAAFDKALESLPDEHAKDAVYAAALAWTSAVDLDHDDAAAAAIRALERYAARADTTARERERALAQIVTICLR